MVNTSTFAYDSLEEIRGRLLDLSSRNSLLNFKISPIQSKSIGFVDTTPNDVFKALIDNKTLDIVSVPTPTPPEVKRVYGDSIKDQATLDSLKISPETWAKHLNIKTDYELPHEDVSIKDDLKSENNSQILQALMYPKDLDVRLNKIRQQAESSINETGSNILYLSIGFLEWYESEDSSLKRLAPLYTIPIKLVKKTSNKKSTFNEYQITALDDGLLSNVTLQKKLKFDFGIDLPSITEEQTPDEYFNTIENIIEESGFTWRISRRIQLCLLNFTKQVMYLDLDSKNWPESNPIEDHKTIKGLFSKVALDSIDATDNFSSEHYIDKVDNIHDKFPIIFDADSSQHSALIDAVNGANLIIEGPPGTGKSQTIANLIAASINNGKKVLFVAEKMAALNVVKERLDNAGLGGFCLELHSHKSNKIKILNELVQQKERLDSYIENRKIQQLKRNLESNQDDLNKYVEIINKEWRATGLTIHQILTKAAYLKISSTVNPELIKIDNLDIDKVDEEFLSNYSNMGGLIQSAYERMIDQCDNNCILNHFCYGIEKTNIIDSEKYYITEALKEWTDCLESLLIVWNKVFLKQEVNCLKLTELNQISEHLVQPISDFPYHLLDQLVKNYDILLNYQELYRNICSTRLKMEKVFTQKYLASEYNQSNNLILSISQNLSFDKDINLENLKKAILKLEDIKSIFTSINNDLNEIKEHIPSNIHNLLGCSAEQFKDMDIFIGHLKALPVELFSKRSDIFSDNSLDIVIEQLEPIFKNIQINTDICKDIYKLDELPEIESLKLTYKNLCSGGFFKYFTPRWWAAKSIILSLKKSESLTFPELQKYFIHLIEYRENIDKLDTIHAKNPVLGNLYNGAQTEFNNIKTLRSWYKNIRKEYGVGFSDSQRVSASITEMDSSLIEAILNEYDIKIIPKLKTLSEMIDEFSINYQKYINGFTTVHDIIDSNSTLSLTLTGMKKIFNDFSSVISDTNLSFTTISEMLQMTQQYQKLIDEFNLICAEQPSFVDYWKLDISTSNVDKVNLTKLASACKLVGFLSDIIKTIEFDLKSIIDMQSHAEINTNLDKIIQLFKTSGHLAEKFKTTTNYNDQLFSQLYYKDISEIIRKNKLSLEHSDWLYTWSDYYSIIEKANTAGLAKIITCLTEGIISSKNTANVIELSIYDNLAKKIITEDVLIQRYSGVEMTNIANNFKKNDAELLDLQRKQIAHNASKVEVPIGVNTGRVGNFTEFSLIEREATKKTRHIPIRDLLLRSQQSIQALKPCFMMSPMSVSQYLKAGLFNFDLVIMDEASQILPEDAIGAIARGKSAVIVGDPKQLPPTSFFSSAVDTEDFSTAEITAVQESESILDAVSMFKKRRLRWHYRSRHQSLIAFSNKHFYNSDLILFPSPVKISNELGIRFKYVHGAFEGGVNRIEAQEVVSNICDMLLNSNGKESIGVVAMNSKQKEEIENQLEIAISENPLLQKSYDQNMGSHEPIFIKNLENVQGDERDVIVISMTYGPIIIDGKVPQRFGPINQDSGWRRLNVLFTRSKKRMHIFSSMYSTDIAPKDSSSRGVVALKNFLRYAETGFLHEEKITNKEPDSDFEIAVIEALKAHGYECEPQLGVAGYFLDIVVKNPNNPQEYLIAIECDGATYHSAKSSRDRDRLRQQVLEGLGWKIHRIWSTDWFKNAQEQINLILNKLKSMPQKKPLEINSTEKSDPNDSHKIDEE